MPCAHRLSLKGCLYGRWVPPAALFRSGQPVALGGLMAPDMLCVECAAWGPLSLPPTDEGRIYVPDQAAETPASCWPAHELRQNQVLDPRGRFVGEVANLYVDENERELHFVEVVTGGFLGLGKKHHLVPVEAEELSDDL